LSESHLFKAFNQLKYAEDFLNKGVMRFAKPEYFGSLDEDSLNQKKLLEQISNPRFDDLDGVGIHRMGTGAICTVISANPTYIYSSSRADVDPAHLRTFGAFIVKISDPRRLVSAVRKAVKQLKLNICELPDWRGVTYDQELVTFPEVYGPLDYGLTQKNIRFENDKEQRMLFQLFDVPGTDTPLEMFLEVGPVRDFCSLVNDCTN
jgi:hypothetical protein